MLMKTLKQYRYLTMAILTAALLGCGSDDESKTVPVNIAMAPDVSMNSQSVNGDAGINEQMAADQRVTADPVPDAALLEEPDAASPNDMTQLCACVPLTGIPYILPAKTLDVALQPPM